MAEIYDIEELNSIVGANTFVVVDFFTPECPPCKLLAPFIEVLREEYTQITFLKVNCNKQNNIAPQFQIAAVPVLLYIKNGKVVNKTMGADRQEILATINNF